MINFDSLFDRVREESVLDNDRLGVLMRNLRERKAAKAAKAAQRQSCTNVNPDTNGGEI